jgi:hypothetical protein
MARDRLVTAAFRTLLRPKASETGCLGMRVFCGEEMLVGPKRKSKFALSETLEILSESDEYLGS